MVRTEIFRHANEPTGLMFALLFGWLGKTAWQGAQTTIQAALTQEDVSGRFLSDCTDAPMLYRHPLVGNSAAEAKFYKASRSILGMA